MQKHFFVVDETKLNLAKKLLESKIDNQFVILTDYGTYSDIAQFSSKYNNLKFATVTTKNLDRELELL